MDARRFFLIFKVSLRHTMPRSHSKREGSSKRNLMVSVETQTEENDFCLCFVPTYMCKQDEELVMDTRISADLNRVDWESQDGKCFVRNFEVMPKKNPKQRWRISGMHLFKSKVKYLFMGRTIKRRSVCVSTINCFTNILLT